MLTESNHQTRTPAQSEHLEWLVNLAVRMMELGVSDTVARDLLAVYPPEEIERQLLYLPYRKAKKPVSLLVAAIKGNYEKPANFFEEEADAA